MVKIREDVLKKKKVSPREKEVSGKPESEKIKKKVKKKQDQKIEKSSPKLEPKIKKEKTDTSHTLLRKKSVKSRVSSADSKVSPSTQTQKEKKEKVEIPSQEIALKKEIKISSAKTLAPTDSVPPTVPEKISPKPFEQKTKVRSVEHRPAKPIQKEVSISPPPPPPPLPPHAEIEKESFPTPSSTLETQVKPFTEVPVTVSSHLPSPPKPKILINEMTNVKDLAEKMNLKVGDLLMRLLKMGMRASLNQRLDIDTAILLSSELGFEAEFAPIYSEDIMVKSEKDDSKKMVHRAPIVTIMGHVDHGKTSLLDAIRETRVAEKEAGGITQHVGAYKVQMDKGAIIFLDTPGHEAFTAMRARGTQVTDIVCLVVAADDGVMPQTVEAIDHARAAEVPILVVVNKIDLPQAKPERIKQELSKYQLTPEEWGGKTIFVEVSAKQKLNIDKLLEMILLEAELLELKANPDRPGQGVVIEAKLDPKKGTVVTVLVQNGSLKIGSTFVCGLTSGKVRSLTNEHGVRLLEAGPSTPVEVLGFSETPYLGERVIVVNSEREAREIADRRKEFSRAASMERKRHISLETLSEIAKQGKLEEFNLILKADVQGSLEALKDSIEKIAVPKIRLKVIHSGVGGVTESDVSLAAASDAVIIGFTVRPETAAEELARREGVEIKSYRIIYEVVSDIRAAMEGLLEPEEKEVSLGRVEVREVFKTSGGKIAGCIAVQGKVNRNSNVRLLRDSKIIFEGKISSLRRFKEDVREVEQGYECGISLENFQDFNKGDIFEIFVKEKQTRKLAG